MSLAPTPPCPLPHRLAALSRAAALGLIVLGTSHSLRGADPKPSPLQLATAVRNSGFTIVAVKGR